MLSGSWVVFLVLTIAERIFNKGDIEEDTNFLTSSIEAVLREEKGTRLIYSAAIREAEFTRKTSTSNADQEVGISKKHKAI